MDHLTPKVCGRGVAKQKSERTDDERNGSVMNEGNQCEDFQGGHGPRSKGDSACVRRAGGPELRRGLVAPVHPLGGHLNFPLHDEKS